MNSIRNSKGLYWGLIITFFVLYALVGFVSTLHSITFFQLANTLWMAVLLGITYEVGQAAVLFSILMSDNNKKMLPWLLMILLTALQVTANVYASFKFMDGSGSMDWTYWQRSILFWLEADGPEMFKVIISWITGALLPIVALGMTALVAENLKLKDEQTGENPPKKPDPVEPKPKIPFDPPTIEPVINSPVEETDEITVDEELYDLQDKISSKPSYPSAEEQKDLFAETLLNNVVKKDPNEYKPKDEHGITIVKPQFEVDIPTETQEGLERGLPTEEVKMELPKIDENLFQKNTKKPDDNPRGWHLKERHVDSNGDVYRYGEFQHAAAEEPDPPKKA